MMNPLLIVFATWSEAWVTIERLSLVRQGPKLYAGDDLLLAISGIGPLASCQTAAQYGTGCREIWNLGAAGSLTNDDSLGCAPGSLFEINQVVADLGIVASLDPHSASLCHQIHTPFSLQEEGTTLVTTNYPIHSETQRNSLARYASLVDMEGYGIAFAAHRLELPCRLWKVVSDNASSGSETTIKATLTAISGQLAELIVHSL